MDRTTDTGNVEDELVVALCCKKDDVSREIKSCARYLSITTPNKADADGLVNCLGEVLTRLGINDVVDSASVLAVKPVLVGGGTHGHQ